MLWPSVGKEMSPLLFTGAVFIFSAVLIVGVPFPFSVKGRMWNSIVSVPDHCLFSMLLCIRKLLRFSWEHYFNRLPYFTALENHPFLSSPEPKAHRWAYSIGRHPSSVVRRPSVVVRQHFQTTSPLKPWSRFLPNFTYSIYRPGKRILMFFVPIGKALWLLWKLIVSIDL